MSKAEEVYRQLVEMHAAIVDQFVMDAGRYQRMILDVWPKLTDAEKQAMKAESLNPAKVLSHGGDPYKNPKPPSPTSLTNTGTGPGLSES